TASTMQSRAATSRPAGLSRVMANLLAHALAPPSGDGARPELGPPILRAMLAVAGARTGSLWLCDPRTGRLTLAATAGALYRSTPDLAAGLTGAVPGDAPREAGDGAAAFPPAAQHGLPDGGSASSVRVELACMGRQLGVVVLYDRRPAYFTPVLQANL